jgi:hypothetical protein
MNNYDKIKNMTVDEMAEYISKSSNCGKCAFLELNFACHCECSKGIKQWLEEECEDEN